MKQNLRLFMLTLLCAVFSIPLEAQTTYTKVTSTDDITDGEYLIVYEDGNVAFDGSLTTLDAVGNTVAVVITDGTITGSAEIDAATFTIDTTNGTLQSASGLYIGVSSNSNGLKQTDNEETYTHEFSIDDNGDAVIKAVFEGSTMTMRFNSASNQNRFRYYKSGQQAIQLYKKNGGTPVVYVATPTFDPASGTTFEDELTISIICDTDGATIYYTTDGSTPTTSSDVYNGDLTISETTTVKAFAVKNGMANSGVATATYTKVESLTLKTIAQAREQATGEVLTQGVVTSLNGNYAYIQDATAAIYVYGGCSSFSIGDEIKVQGTLSTYKGLLEITPTSCTLVESGKTVTPEVMTIAQVNASTNQGWLIKIEEATVQSISGQDVTIAQGTNTILVRFNKTGDITFAANDIITLTGNIGCFNTVQIANPRDITVKENEEGSIIPKDTYVGVDANGDNGTIEVTYNLIGSPEILFYEADGETAAEYDWISAELDDDWNIEYSVDENTGQARTAYMKVFGYGPEDEEVFSELITISQEAYVAPGEPKTYQKVTSTDDITDGNYLIVYEDANVAFDGSLTTLDAVGNIVEVEIDDDLITTDQDIFFTIDVTNGTLQSASGLYIGVSSNSNGLKQTDNEEAYTHEFSIDDNEDAVIAAVFTGSTMTLRFNKASNQNRFRYYKDAGQQPIQLYKEIDEVVKVPTITTDVDGITVGADGDDGTIIVDYKNFGDDFDVVGDLVFYTEEGEEDADYSDWLYVEINEENNVYYSVSPNTGEARTAYFKVTAMDADENMVYSKLITINQEAFVLDYATIPFEFNGGKADIEDTDGLTQEGIDNKDYSTETTKLKFNTTGDWMILKLEEHAETALELAYDIKGNTFSGGTFTVLTSADGEEYTELAIYEELGDVQTEVFELDEDIRYIKWIYTEKVSGNVGLGNIQVIVPEEVTVTFNNRAEGYSTLFYGTKNLIIPDGVKAYTYKVGDDGKAVETEYENYIPKGSAVVVELEDKDLVAESPYNVTFTTTAGSEPAHTDNMLLGFDEGGNTTVGPDENKEYLFYSLSLNKNKDKGSIGFYWNQPNGAAFTITAAHRAYLAVEKDLANGASAFTFDNTGTGINSIFANGLPADGVYTLTGVRVNSDSLQKGIYIVNGKKVVIK